MIGSHQFCFLCGRNGTEDRLEEHHIFPGSLRDKSEQYGLTVYLCGNRCHRLGPQSAHRCRDTQLYLKQIAQAKAMRENGWTLEDWHREFGKSYVEFDDAGKPIVKIGSVAVSERF